jgi:hypothetical protein
LVGVDSLVANLLVDTAGAVAVTILIGC